MEFTEFMLGGLTCELFFCVLGICLNGLWNKLNCKDVLHRKPESPNSFYKFDLGPIGG